MIQWALILWALKIWVRKHVLIPIELDEIERRIFDGHHPSSPPDFSVHHLLFGITHNSIEAQKDLQLFVCER